MLGKLAFKNAKRSIKDYLIYIITVTIAVSLIFAFNSIVFSRDILRLSSIMKNFKFVIFFISIIVVFIVGWLINYTINFSFRRRSKEFGTYMLLGIENKSISRLFLIENLIIESIALFFGIFLGIYIFQIISVIIMNIFKSPYKISINISWQAVLLTIGYFIIITIFSLLKNNKKLKRMKIYDLIYSDKINETSIINNNKYHIIIFTLSIILLVIGILILKRTMQSSNEISLSKVFLSTVLIIFSIYCFYFTISSSIEKIIKNKKVKYSGNNLFILRSLTSKINTMSITFGNLGVLFTLTLISLNIGVVLNNVFDHMKSISVPTDFVIWSYSEKENFQDYKEYIHDHFSVVDEIIYECYTIENSEIASTLQNTKYSSDINGDIFIKESEYNYLRQLLGYRKIELNENEFVIQTSYRGIEKQLIKNNKDLLFEVENIKLNYKGTYNDAFPIDKSSYLVIVSDEFLENKEVSYKYYVVDTIEETTEKDYEDLCKYIVPDNTSDNFIPLGNVRVEGQIKSENNGFTTIISFSAFYLAIIFICTALTILSIQQLSDSDKYRYRYDILDKLGLERRKLNILVLKQLTIYFLLPLFLPIIITFLVVICINQFFGIYLISNLSVITFFGQMLLLFLIIYLIYFVATYVGFIKNIKI